MDARNFTFMFYGFLAAWLIVLLYVISLARRGARLQRELEQVKQLAGASHLGSSHLGSKQIDEPARLDNRPR